MANHILAIGISSYRGIRSLQYAAKDAKDLYYLFANNVDDIGYQVLLVDSEATLASIRNSLGAELQEAVGVDDAFFFFFSGHGALAASQEGEGFSNYLLPFDASDDILNTAISIEYLKGRFSKINCKNKLIIIDSCFSGSINSKAYTQLNIKSLNKVKTFENTISGKGHITFTASKEDEEAIEDIELKNGLFTYYFLEELQNSSHGERIPLLSIHAPVTEHVIQRAKDKYSFEQTPTLKGEMEGVLYLPLFKKRLKISPEEIEIPTHPELQQTLVPSFELDIEDKKIRDDINKLLDLVAGSRRNDQARIIESKRLVTSAIRKLRDAYEGIFREVGDDVSKIPESIAKLESNSYYIQLIGCVISAFGNGDLMEDYAEQVGDILGFGMGKSGLTALIDIPEIVLVNITYLIGITSLVNGSLDLFCKFLSTKIYDTRNLQYVELYKRYDIHYCSSLGGKATTVGDHIQSTIDNNTWLTILCPQIEGKKMEYRLQVNFLLGAFCYSHGIKLFADYGRFYGTRIMPLVARIRDDSIFAAKVANFLGKEEGQLIDFLKEYLKEADYKGAGLWWHSIGPSIFDNKIDFL
jgi:hypothetical protein